MVDAHRRVEPSRKEHPFNGTIDCLAEYCQRLPIQKSIRKAIEFRLFALSRSHDLLTREKWESAGLFDIVHDALEPFGISGERADRIVFTGENIRFPPKSAMALGIAFNELATNAVKYGALSNAAGSILIEWTMRPHRTGQRLLPELEGEEMVPRSRHRHKRDLDRG